LRTIFGVSALALISPTDNRYSLSDKIEHMSSGQWSEHFRRIDSKRCSRSNDRKAAHPAKAFASGSLASSRVAASLSTAAANGLTPGKKRKRLSGRAHEELFAAAVARSGLDGSDLLEYALAKVAPEDDFAERLLARSGAIDRGVDLGI
jgi:hypothetical protein